MVRALVQLTLFDENPSSTPKSQDLHSLPSRVSNNNTEVMFGKSG